MNHKAAMDVNGSPENPARFSAGTRINSEVKKKSMNHRLVNCILVFCMASGILTTSVVIHLGIENYNRLKECRELRMEIDWLKLRLNATLVEFGGYFKQAANVRNAPLQNGKSGGNPETGAMPAMQNTQGTVSDTTVKQPTDKQAISKEKEASTEKNNQQTEAKPEPDSRKEVSKLARAEPLALFESDTALQNIESKVQHCIARMRELEHVQREFGYSQDFLRQQMHQRFTAIDNLLEGDNGQASVPVAFSVFISSDVTLKPREDFESDVESVLTFDTAVLNEGSGFSTATGIFRAPQGGVYVFYLSLHVAASVTNNLVHSLYADRNTEDTKTCITKIRKNGQSLMLAASKVSQESDYEKWDNYETTDFTSSDDVTLSVTLVTRLLKGDTVDVAITENSLCTIVGRKSTMLSTFQGFMLQG